MKLLILELEGTLVEFGEPGGAWVELDLIGFEKPKEPKYRGLIIRDRTHERLMYYKERGYTIIVMTHRPDVAMGTVTLDDVFSLFMTVNGLLGNIIDGFMVCPDHPDGVVTKYAVASKCYESKSGLLPKLYEELKTTAEDIEDAIVVSHLEDRDWVFAADNGWRYRTPAEFF